MRADHDEPTSIAEQSLSLGTLTIVRRLGVLVTLLVFPSLFQIVWYISLNRQPPVFGSGFGHFFAYFAWGVSHSYPLIGIWLVSRDQLFRSWGGRLRAVVYLFAANCGWTAGSILQAWHHSEQLTRYDSPAPFRYVALATLLSLQVAICAWLFWPLLHLLRRRLTVRQLSVADIPRPNLRFLLAWITLAALILMSVRIFVTHGHVMNLGMASGSIAAAMLDLAMGLMLQIVRFASLAVIMIGFASRPKYWIGAMIAAIAIQFVGQQVLFWVVSLVADPREYYGVAAGPWSESLPLFAGTMFVSIATFWFARVTGLTFARATTPSS
jgi:hypothetical protein